jgi:hypothetical protein
MYSFIFIVILNLFPLLQPPGVGGDAPLDGGIIFLLGGGLIYGIKKLINLKKDKK